MNLKAALADRLGNLTTVAQRHGVRAPRFLSGPIRSAFARQLSGAADVEDWSRPLIDGKGIPGQQSLNDPPAGEPPEVISMAAADGLGADGPPAEFRRPRCVLVTGSLDVGGMEEVVTLLARLLPGEGLATAVLHALPDSHSGEAPLGRLGVLLSTRHHLDVAALGRAAGQRWLAAQAPDVISAHGAPGWVLDWALDHGVPYVDNFHGMHDLYDVDWDAEALRSRSLAGVITVSDLMSRQYLSGNPEFPLAHCRTIPIGVDQARRQPRDRERVRAELGLTHEYLFACVARFCLQKNMYALVDAFAEVGARFADAHLVVAGRPDDLLYLRQTRLLRDRIAPPGRIHLRDHTTDPGRLLAASDGFVLNSFFEGGPIASKEALYAGIPVVLTEVGSALEQVGGRSTSRGFVVSNPLGDPLEVNWDRMRAARFERQANREELIEAISTLVRCRDDWADLREELAAESAARFGQEATLRAHAHALTSAARTGSIAT